MLRKFIAFAVVVLCVANFALGGQLWTTTPIQGNPPYTPINSQHVALGMRSGGTWPVVAYNGGTAAMTPVGWVFNGQPMGMRYAITGDTSASGLVGFANGTGIMDILGPNGWSHSSFSSGTYPPPSDMRPSMAFTRDNISSVLHSSGVTPGQMVLSTFNGFGWSNDVPKINGTMPINSKTYALDYDSYNQANIAFNGPEGLMFGLKGSLTGNQWLFATVDRAVNPYVIDVGIGAGDIPYLAYSMSNQLYYAMYDPHQNGWTKGYLGSLASPMSFFDMAVDSLGGVGIAYVAQGDVLTYAYSDGTSGWNVETAATSAMGYNGVALAFDRDNNAVICYTSRDGRLWMADAVAVPEPATLLLLACGCGILRRLKNQ